MGIKGLTGEEDAQGIASTELCMGTSEEFGGALVQLKLNSKGFSASSASSQLLSGLFRLWDKTKSVENGSEKELQRGEGKEIPSLGLSNKHRGEKQKKGALVQDLWDKNVKAERIFMENLLGGSGLEPLPCPAGCQDIVMSPKLGQALISCVHLISLFF